MARYERIERRSMSHYAWTLHGLDLVDFSTLLDGSEGPNHETCLDRIRICCIHARCDGPAKGCPALDDGREPRQDLQDSEIDGGSIRGDFAGIAAGSRRSWRLLWVHLRIPGCTGTRPLQSFLPPGELTVSAAIEIVADHFDRNPQHRGHTGLSVVKAALENAFPCRS